MVSVLESLRPVCDLADGQFGYVTHVQACGSTGDDGYVQALLSAGVAELVTAGVVRLRAGGRHPFPSLYAGWLELEPATPAWERSTPASGVVSHSSALRLYRVGDQPTAAAVEITTPAAGLPAPTDGYVIHISALPQDDWTDVAGIPTTSCARTLVDMAERLDTAELNRIAAAFVAQGWIGARPLAEAVERLLTRHSLSERERRRLRAGVLTGLAG